MKFIFLMLSLFSFNSYGQNLRELCSEWQQIKPKELHVQRWNQQELLALWMQSKGISSSEFLVASKHGQEVECSTRIISVPVFEGYYVCEDEGFEKAEVFAQRRMGLGFYNRIVPWETPREEKYMTGCFGMDGGIKNPSQQVLGKIGSSLEYTFYDLWSPYSASIEGYFHFYDCDYEDHQCIRKAHSEITERFLILLKDFPEQQKKDFERKVEAMNHLREAEWVYRSIP